MKAITSLLLLIAFACGSVAGCATTAEGGSSEPFSLSRLLADVDRALTGAEVELDRWLEQIDRIRALYPEIADTLDRLKTRQEEQEAFNEQGLYVLKSQIVQEQTAPGNRALPPVEE